ncbi:MAG: hypothetical protein R3B57_05460 [Phycisphaerales bacterium]
MNVQHLQPRRVTPDDGWHYWFGYYDTCPWSNDQTRLLAHRARFLDRFPTPDDACEIGFIEGWGADDPVFTKLAESRAWNWQQGARLQWVTIDGSERIVFNDRRDTKPVCVILDQDGGEYRVLSAPVYALSRDATSAVTLDFGRLTRLRPEYGLPGLTDPNAADPSPANDGVFRLDLHTGAMTLICPIHALDTHTLPGRPSPAGAPLHQHVNHLMFNPSGTRFCFMHRFDRPDGILHSRLFTSNLDGSDVRLLFEGMCSHYDWADDTTILAWAGKRALLGDGAGASRSPMKSAMTLARRALKPVYYALGKPRVLMNKILKDSYLLIEDREGAMTTPFAAGELITDGHCTYNRRGPDPGRWVLTDGYPDLKSRQPLFLWDTRTSRGFEIARLPTPRALDREVRVDLHPRFSRDARMVCVDSALDGARRMYVFDVSSITPG